MCVNRARDLTIVDNMFCFLIFEIFNSFVLSMVLFVVVMFVVLDQFFCASFVDVFNFDKFCHYKDNFLIFDFALVQLFYISNLSFKYKISAVLNDLQRQSNVVFRKFVFDNSYVINNDII